MTFASDEASSAGGQGASRTRFVVSSRPAAAAGASESSGAGPHAAGARDRGKRLRRALGASLLAGAVGSVVFAAGTAGADPAEQRQAQLEARDLREQIEHAQAGVEGLPTLDDAEHALVTASQAAADVAALQNEYWRLTPAAAANGGQLDATTVAQIRRALTPYFATDTAAELLAPWYLLATDAQPAATPLSAEQAGPQGSTDAADTSKRAKKKRPKASKAHKSTKARKPVKAAPVVAPEPVSGFAWVAQQPFLVNRDGGIDVVLLARASGTNIVLAWAKAEYDVTKRVFGDLQVATTIEGDRLRLGAQPIAPTQSQGAPTSAEVTR